MAINSKTRREKLNALCCCDQQKYYSQCLVRRIRSDLWFYGLNLLVKSARKAETKKILQNAHGRSISHSTSVLPHVNARTLHKPGPLFPAAGFCWLFLKDKLEYFASILEGNNILPRPAQSQENWYFHKGFHNFFLKNIIFQTLPYISLAKEVAVMPKVP